MAGKSPEAFRTISEVADWLDRPAHVLRFWESKFNQVKPVKRAGGRRYYRPEDMLLLGGIKKLLHDDGMTIKGAQKVLREQGVRYVSALSQPLDEDGAVLTVAAVAAPDTGVAVVAPERVAATDADAADAAQVAEHQVAEDGAADTPDDGTQTADLAPDPSPAAPIPVPASVPRPVATPDTGPLAAEALAAIIAAPGEVPAPAAPAPLGLDLPPPPDLSEIAPRPGLLSVIATRQAPLPAPAQAAMAAILVRLDDLVMRMSAARRS